MAQITNNPLYATAAIVGEIQEVAFDASNPTPIQTDLRTIHAVMVTQKRTTAPGLNTSIVTYDTPAASPGLINFYAWKPTSATDPTLIASTGTETFGFVAFGTR